MELNFMRFCGKPFGYGLIFVSMYSDKELKKTRLCSGENVLENFGRELMVIKGKGEIPSSAAQVMSEMQAVFTEGDRGILVMPEYPPFYAVLHKLKFNAEGDGNAVDYEFEFYELPREKGKAAVTEKHTVKSGENLWTIAHAYGAAVEELLRLNPQIRRPDRLNEGEEVLVQWL